MSIRTRKKASMPKKLEQATQELYTMILQLLIMSMIVITLYMMFFPLIVSSILDLTNIDGDLPIFPVIDIWLDYYGTIAFLLYFLIHVLVSRILIHNNRIFFIAMLSVLLTLGIHLLISQWIFGMIAFIEGTSEFSEHGFMSNWSIRSLNILALIVLYSFVYILLIFITKPQKRPI